LFEVHFQIRYVLNSIFCNFCSSKFVFFVSLILFKIFYFSAFQLYSVLQVINFFLDLVDFSSLLISLFFNLVVTIKFLRLFKFYGVFFLNLPICGLFLVNLLNCVFAFCGQILLVFLKTVVAVGFDH
jgi:hypothetical protein